MRALLIILFFIPAPALFYGQNINYYSFNNLYQFKSSTIYDIEQDNEGNFWIGTDLGLYKFDGAEFHYHVTPYYNSEYTNIKIDKNGDIWFSNFGGQLFKYSKDKVSIIVDTQNEIGFISNYFIDFPHVYYVNNLKRSLQVLDMSSGKTKEIVKNEENAIIDSRFSNSNIHLYHIVKKETVKPLHLYKTKYHVKTKEISTEVLGSFAHETEGIIRIVPSLKGDLLSTTHNNTKISSVNENKKLFSLPVNFRKFNAVQTVDSATYFLTKDKLIKLLPQKSTLIENKNVSCLKKDIEGNMWIGTLDEGIFISSNPDAVHQKITDSRIENYTITDDGHIIFNTSKGDIKLLSPPQYSAPKLLFKNASGGPITMFPDNESFFSGTTGKIYNYKTREVVTTNSRTSFKQITFVDSDAFVFTDPLMSSVGFIKRNKPYEIQFKKLRSKRSVKVAALKSRVGFYVDFMDGLYFYHDISQPGKQLKYNKKPVLITAISKGKDSTVWVSTNENNLLQIKDSTVIKEIKFPHKAEQITVRDTLLFANNKSEIYIINLLNEEVQIINQTDGLLKSNIKGVFTRNGKLFILSSNSLQSLPLNSSFKNNRPPVVSLDHVKNYDQVLTLDAIKNLKTHQNNLTFVLKGISVKSQGAVKYRHKLKGIDSNWITTFEQKPEIRFSNLSPGNYTLIFKACNNDEVCSDHKYVEFSITPPIYKTTPFLITAVLLSIIVLIGSVKLYIHYHQRKIKAKQKTQDLERKFYKAKISAIRSQMNPHFLFNALNTIQEFILTNQKNIAGEYLADFADLMRTYLNQSKNDKICLRDEVEMLRIYLRLENLRFENSIKFSIQVDPAIDSSCIEIPVMLVQPFVENSIKHGLLKKTGERTLNVNFEFGGESGLKCTIKDNGIGRKAAAKNKNSQIKEAHNSFATNALKERIDLLNSKYSQKVTFKIIDLYDDYKNPLGTQVEIFISA